MSSGIQALDAKVAGTDPFGLANYNRLKADIDALVTGWSPITALAWVSTDGHTFVVSTGGEDLTGIISPGARIKLTDSGTKYFIVTAVSATQLTLYGGQNYSLTGGAITSPYFSREKAPAGFPLDAASWTEVLSDNSARSQASPTAATWYNPGALSLAIPIGAWRLRWEATPFITTAGSGTPSIAAALSTANNSLSDGELRADETVGANSAGTWVFQAMRSKPILLAAKTTYYLIINNIGGLGGSSIGFKGDEGNSTIRAECAYL